MKMIFLGLALTASVVVGAQKGAAGAAAAITALNQALIDGDSARLQQLTMGNLQYGHSTGKVEDQAMFIHNATQAGFDYLSIDIGSQTVDMVKRTAVVRQVFNAKATSNGTPTELHLTVLQVWQRDGGNWKLLARQAAKL